MSIEICKIIQTYKQCAVLLQAKGELLVEQNIPVLTFSPTETTFSSQNCQETVGFNILENLIEVLSNWQSKWKILSQFSSNNLALVTELNNKQNQLKNDVTVQSQEEQILSKINKNIQEWKNIKDPIVIYDVKKRLETKDKIMKRREKLQEVEGKPVKNQVLNKRKIAEQSFKNVIYKMYSNAARIDERIRQKWTQSWNESINKMLQILKSLKNSPVTNKDKFTSGSSQNIKIRKDNIYKRIRQSLQEIQAYKSIVKGVAIILQRFSEHFVSFKNEFQKKQTKIIGFLSQTNETIGSLFGLQNIINLMVCFNMLYQIINMINKFGLKIQAIQQKIEKTKSIIVSVGGKQKLMASFDEEQLTKFQAENKDIFETYQKEKQIINNQLSLAFEQFLQNCLKVSKDNIQRFQSEKLEALQYQKVCEILMKQPISSPTLSKPTESVKKQALKQKQKKQIQDFYQGFHINQFASSKFEKLSFACALGPKLLLHGKLSIQPQGSYFESSFNKSNLFFGGTKLFIPKEDIMEIRTNSTLGVIPDSVEVVTKEGTVFFNSLVNRNEIAHKMNQTYFSDSTSSEEQIGQLKIVEAQEKIIQEKYNKSEIDQLLKPFEMDAFKKTIKNIKLSRFFRKYLSEQSFQFKGETFENFKSYIMLQIGAVDPKTTNFTPNPPSYFQQKNEQVQNIEEPKSSTRIHTYKKSIPKVPFLSKGGYGECIENQTYNWISPKLLIVTTVGKVGGFSLTEGMQMIFKSIYREEGEDVQTEHSAYLKFAKDSSINNLVKGPTLTNVKDTMVLMMDTIQKLQKLKKSRSILQRSLSKKDSTCTSSTVVSENNNINQTPLFVDPVQLKAQIQSLKSENIAIKQKYNKIIAALILLYLISMFAMII